MTDKIRWFRCVSEGPDLTVGKLYPATTVDYEGDLAVVDDKGYVQWVVITESHKHKSYVREGEVKIWFKEVTNDEND